MTTSADDGAGSLRAAVSAANASAGADVVAFDAAVFDGGSEDLIRLTSGQINFTDGLTITGGSAGVTITGDANGDDVTRAGGITDVDASLEGQDRLDDNSRLFNSNTALGTVLTLDGLTLTGGRTTGGGNAGGAVRGVSSSVTLIDSTVSGNSTAGEYAEGGGISSTEVTLINSTINGNSTAGYTSIGGGVSGSRVNLIDSTVSGNSTTGFSADGGGIGGGYITLTNSTVSGNNTAGDNSEGGGVWGFDVTISNSTVSGNSTAGNDSEGAGVWGYNSVTLINSTVSGNSTAGNNSIGGGVHSDYGDVTLTNSIVLGNATVFAGVGGEEVEGNLTLTSGNIVGGNLFDGDADMGDVTPTEVFAATAEIAPAVLAGVLADNGGPTRTILIAADGPAVDAGGAATLPTDQRGLERISGAAVDLGAVELGTGPAELGSLVVTTALDVVANDGLTSLREAVFYANLELGTDTISFDASAFDGDAADVIRLTSGQIAITDGLTIEGGAAGVTITGDANGDDVTLAGGITDVMVSLEGEDRLDDNNRIFDTTDDLTLDRLTLTGGRTTGSSQGGGAVRGKFDTTVTLIDSMVSGNSSVGNSSSGGGVSGLDVILIDSTVSGNSTAGDNSYGGGVFGTNVTLTNSTVSGNRTAGDYSDGGGISGNRVSLTNGTISGNSTAGDYSDGGGVHTFYGYGGNGEVTLTNSIVLGNAMVFGGGNGDEVEGAITRTGGNIVGGDLFDGMTDVGDVTAAEVFSATTEIAPGMLAGALADNGGSTRTIAIRADGPAAGAAESASATAADQRGFARDDAPDLGAFEAGVAGGLKLVGGLGADLLTGGPGDDRICGRGGNDVLRGLAGDDLLRGGTGCDTLKGGAGDDVIFGEKGDDRLKGGAGDDMLYGGKGHDVFVFGPDPGADTIFAFDANARGGQDRMDLSALGISAASFSSAVTIAQVGDDTLIILQGEGSILCSGIDGEGVAVIDQSDFLLLA